MEIWKDVVNYEGLYEVSSLGRIKALPRCVRRNTGYAWTKEIIMSPKNDKDGYKTIGLRDASGKKKFFRIHRLVLLAFKGAPTFEGALGLHLDDNPANNCIENLTWGTNSENVRQAIERGRKPPSKPWQGKTGAGNPGSKKILMLSSEGTILNTFHGIKEANRITNVNRTSISACCLGKRNLAGGFKWKYAE